MAYPRFAFLRRRLRQKFGITAQKVAVRSELPWYVRALILLTGASITAASAMWLYDSGRSLAGFDHSDSGDEIARLKETIGSLNAELQTLRASAHASNSRLQLETTALDNLATQLRTLQRENAALKEDLVLFESLVGDGASNAGIRIVRFDVTPFESKGKWRFSALIVNASGGKVDRESNAELRLELLARRDGKDVTIAIPAAGPGAPNRFAFTVKHFKRVDGEFLLPAESLLKSGEVKLIQDGSVKAKRSFSL